MELKFSKAKFNKKLIQNLIIMTLVVAILSLLFFYFAKILFDSALILLIIIAVVEILLVSLIFYFFIYEMFIYKKRKITIIDNSIIVKYEDESENDEYNISDIKIFSVRYKKNNPRNIIIKVKRTNINLYMYEDESLRVLLNILEERMSLWKH